MQENETGADPGPRDGGLLGGWITRAELAEELAVSIDTLCRWDTRRIGPPSVRAGRKVLYRVESVRAWLREQENKKAKGRR
ncbi:helix-turn-helix domain-containing protein [Tropicimonas isoalkanivorans]|uniref:Helix-turn-helix domain-containing protein n=1 Tax=Tropicimonas isoalkanivorans TaxID=441112 RepID=A0A1I1JEQ3_9RHOB|nr:helix-turn-helix domain-containing protein [Tropicimonas isoalkanivorans]SFC44453.1 hypothetical protein SAMN04488094_1056 [Tropicimonas isoalkanivorans]